MDRNYINSAYHYKQIIRKFAVGYNNEIYKLMAKDTQVYDEAFGLLADDAGVLDAKVMGVYGAMRRGLSKDEALKKYDLTEKDYDENIDRVLK